VLLGDSRGTFGPRYYATTITDLLVDNLGSTYLLGSTNATNLPVSPGAFLASNPSQQTIGFVAKLSADAAALEALSYLPDQPVKSTLSSDGQLHIVTGSTYIELSQTALALTAAFPLSSIPFDPAGVAVTPGSVVWLWGRGNVSSYLTSSSLQSENYGSNAALIEVGTIQPTVSAVKNAASFSSELFAPGELITIFGSEFGPRPGIDLQLNGQTVTSKSSGRVVPEVDASSNNRSIVVGLRYRAPW
jgi:hypothetical protein